MNDRWITFNYRKIKDAPEGFAAANVATHLVCAHLVKSKIKFSKILELSLSYSCLKSKNFFPKVIFKNQNNKINDYLFATPTIAESDPFVTYLQIYFMLLTELQYSTFI